MNILYRSAWLFRVGILITLLQCNSTITNAQCDFINDITGLSLGTPPAGDAANPALYTQVYVLVDENGNIHATSSTPDFLTVSAGSYNLYGVNYDNAEAATVLAMLVVGQPWIVIENYGNNAANCLDFTTAYGTGCPIVVCEQLSICEVDSLANPSLGFAVTDYTQNYCLVCADQVEAVNNTGVFALADYAAAGAGANCQLYAVNYSTTGTFPIATGDTWSTTVAPWCNDDCFDFIGMDLDITPITQNSGSGVSTTQDWWDTSDGCAGAQTSINAGNTFNTTVNNYCVPPYSPTNIVAKPGGNTTPTNDLTQMMGQYQFASRVPCIGSMDMTQNPVFYTVECDPSGPSQLNVLVSNPGAGISLLQATLYGPVNAACPTFSGGTFVDCNDAGAGSNSGNPVGNINLSTTGNPGDVFIVIVDTEGRDVFTISSNQIILSNKLLSFAGDKVGDANLLTWQVENDENVAEYILERSADAVLFAPINQRTRTESTSTVASYNYNDNTAGSGTKYYRLKTVLIDGSIEYSNIVVLSRSEDNTGILIYPNPTSSQAFIEFESKAETLLEYTVKDVIGQVVQQGNYPANAGLNKFNLDLEQYPSATYIISLTINGQRVQRKIVKR